MRLWKMELRKIVGRPILNLGLFLIIAFQGILVWTDVSGKQSEIDGHVYRGISAIEADRKLAEEYQGLFTLDKAEQIIERFGFSGYRAEGSQRGPKFREGNFCSQWVTDNMTDFYQTSQKPAALKEGKFWEERGKQYLNRGLHFGYTAGWSYFHNIWSWSVLMLNIWLALMVMPVFSEEYSRKTINVLLASVHGKRKDIWAKAGAALSVGIAAFFLMTVLLLILTVSVYGGEGFEVSAGMFDYRIFMMEGGSMTVGEHLLQSLGAKLASVCLNVCVTLYFSSKFKNTMSAVILRIACLYPLAWIMNELIYSMLFELIYDSGLIYDFLGWVTLDILTILCSCTTYYLSWSSTLGVPENWKVIINVFICVVIAGSLWRAVVNYCKGK